MKRIAIIGTYFAWGGGSHLIRNVVEAVTQTDSAFVEVVLLLESPSRGNIHGVIHLIKNILKSFLFRIPLSQIRQSIGLSNREFLDSLGDLGRKISVVFYKSGELNGAFLEKLNINLVLLIPPGTDPLILGDVKYIGYLYDFQHKYFPGFFSSKEKVERDRIFGELISSAKTIIVNALSVSKDVDTFYPNHSCKVFALPFAPIMEKKWAGILTEEAGAIRSRYNLPKKYLLISNHFWIHKSHATAFEALAMLEEQNCKDCHIVCTGPTYDWRYPHYYKELKKMVKQAGIGDRIHFLGYVPKLDQVQIMRHAEAVIQPTLFEGGPGGGAVYDAISIGVPCIISDIPPNLEVDADNVWFFKAGSSRDLAEKISDFIGMTVCRPTVAQLLAKRETYVKRLGARLEDIIQYELSSR